LAWDFTKAHWDEIAKISGGFAGAGLVDATSTFCSTERGEQVREFFSTHKVASAERGLEQSLERIHNCADLKSQQSPRLVQWLSDHEVRAGQ
jgi:aminopeptidase N/puromycin-sensitive aminopeptidase